MAHARVGYAFGDFVLDVEQRCLLPDSGPAVPLNAKVFDTLLYLVEHAGETLGKDELLRSIWPDVIVEENSLTQNISTLRQLLGEVRGENRYIVTIPRKGYRFVAKVTTRYAADQANDMPASVASSSVPLHPKQRSGRLIAAGVAALVLAILAIVSVMFLPAGHQGAKHGVDMVAAPRTQNPEAYALYISGQFALSRQTEPDLRKAIDFFGQAIGRDPNYALAYTGLADSYAFLGVFGMRAPHDVFPMARDAVDKALSIDPDLAAAHSALGHIKMVYERDWDGAAREYERALQLDASLASAHHRRGLLYAMQGDTDRALEASERARQIEPLWLVPRAASGNFLYYARRYDESMRLLERVLELDDRADGARAFLIRNLLVTRNYERALAETDKRPIQMPGTRAHRAQALALSGRREAARMELDRVLELSKQRYVAGYDIALIYAALGDANNTFLWLERAVEDRSTQISFLAQDPMFDKLHADARFASLVQRVGIYGRVLPTSDTD